MTEIQQTLIENTQHCLHMTQIDKKQEGNEICQGTVTDKNIENQSLISQKMKQKVVQDNLCEEEKHKEYELDSKQQRIPEKQQNFTQFKKKLDNIPEKEQENLKSPNEMVGAKKVPPETDSASKISKQASNENVCVDKTIDVQDERSVSCESSDLGIENVQDSKDIQNSNKEDKVNFGGKSSETGAEIRTSSVMSKKEKKGSKIQVPVLQVENNPQQNTFNLPNGLEISSEFDSGNLARCEVDPDDSQRLICHMSGDGLPYTVKEHYRTWFYFSVKNYQPGKPLTFVMKGMALQGKLYKMGLRTVYRTSSSQKWKRCTGLCQWKYESSFSVTFTHQFENCDPEKDHTVYFAWTYPYSFQESLDRTQKLMKKFKNSDTVYVHREILGHSFEKRPMEMVTFTSRKGITDKREPLVEGLFPESKNDPQSRPFTFEKQTIFLSCRVHPGETPASFVLEGILKFLSNEKSQQARLLLDKFVFRIVPCLNPDGVYRGYYRLDTFGQNLNRYYLDPCPVKQSTIYCVRKAIQVESDRKKIDVYCDLHAHASKRGCFMFGNSLAGEQALKAMLLPKLVSMNSLNFDFLECSFSDKMMQCKDKKDGLSREGCGRVSIMKLTGLANCYTLECNYASGRSLNRLTPKLVRETKEVEPEIPITDCRSRHYAECYAKNGQLMKNVAPVYTIDMFEDIGRAFCIGLLDFYDMNPVSRLPSSHLKTLAGVEADLQSHYPIFIPKKKDEEMQKLQLDSNKIGEGKSKKFRGGLPLAHRSQIRSAAASQSVGLASQNQQNSKGISNNGGASKQRNSSLIAPQSAGNQKFGFNRQNTNNLSKNTFIDNASSMRKAAAQKQENGSKPSQNKNLQSLKRSNSTFEKGRKDSNYHHSAQALAQAQLDQSSNSNNKLIHVDQKTKILINSSILKQEQLIEENQRGEIVNNSKNGSSHKKQTHTVSRSGSIMNASPLPAAHNGVKVLPNEQSATDKENRRLLKNGLGLLPKDNTIVAQQVIYEVSQGQEDLWRGHKSKSPRKNTTDPPALDSQISPATQLRPNVLQKQKKERKEFSMGSGQIFLSGNNSFGPKDCKKNTLKKSSNVTQENQESVDRITQFKQNIGNLREKIQQQKNQHITEEKIANQEFSIHNQNEVLQISQKNTKTRKTATTANQLLCHNEVVTHKESKVRNILNCAPQVRTTRTQQLLLQQRQQQQRYQVNMNRAPPPVSDSCEISQNPDSNTPMNNHSFDLAIDTRPIKGHPCINQNQIHEDDLQEQVTGKDHRQNQMQLHEKQENSISLQRKPFSEKQPHQVANYNSDLQVCQASCSNQNDQQLLAINGANLSLDQQLNEYQQLVSRSNQHSKMFIRGESSSFQGGAQAQKVVGQQVSKLRRPPRGISKFGAARLNQQAQTSVANLNPKNDIESSFIGSNGNNQEGATTQSEQNDPNQLTGQHHSDMLSYLQNEAQSQQIDMKRMQLGDQNSQSDSRNVAGLRENQINSHINQNNQQSTKFQSGIPTSKRKIKKIAPSATNLPSQDSKNATFDKNFNTSLFPLLNQAKLDKPSKRVAQSLAPQSDLTHIESMKVKIPRQYRDVAESGLGPDSSSLANVLTATNNEYNKHGISGSGLFSTYGKQILKSKGIKGITNRQSLLSMSSSIIGGSNSNNGHPANKAQSANIRQSKSKILEPAANDQTSLASHHPFEIKMMVPGSQQNIGVERSNQNQQTTVTLSKIRQHKHQHQHQLQFGFAAEVGAADGMKSDMRLQKLMLNEQMAQIASSEEQQLQLLQEVQRYQQFTHSASVSNSIKLKKGGSDSAEIQRLREKISQATKGSPMRNRDFKASNSYRPRHAL